MLLFKDPDGEHARRVLQRIGGGQQGSRGQDMVSGAMNIPPSIVNNPNIPPDVIHALQASRLGNTVFVANVRISVVNDSSMYLVMVIHVD